MAAREGRAVDTWWVGELEAREQEAWKEEAGKEEAGDFSFISFVCCKQFIIFI